MLAKQLIDTIEPQSYAKSCQLQKQSAGLSQLCMYSLSLATPQLPPPPPHPPSLVLSIMMLPLCAGLVGTAAVVG